MEDQLLAFCSLGKENSANESSDTESIILVIERNTTKIDNILDAACKRWNHLNRSQVVPRYFVSYHSMGRRVITLLDDDDVVNMYDLHKSLKESVINMFISPKDMEGAPQVTTEFRGPKMDMSCEDCRKQAKHLYWDHMDVTGIQFLRPMVGNFSQQIMLPKRFVKNFRELQDDVHLKGPSGNIWNVKITRTVDGIFISSSWKDFVEANHVEEHDLLKFTYIGNSCFDILVFDASRCEKPSCCHANSKFSSKRRRIGYSLENLNGRPGRTMTRHGSSNSSHDGIQRRLPFQTLNNIPREHQYSGKGFQRLESGSEDSEEIMDTRSGDIANGGHSAGSSLDDILRGTQLQTPHSLSRENKKEGKGNKRVGSRCRKRVSRSNMLFHNRQMRTRIVKGSKHHSEEESKNQHNKILNPNIFVSRSIMKIEEEFKAVLELDHVFQSDNPCFISIMRPTMIGERNFLTVPYGFREFLPTRHCSISLQVPGRKAKWEVKFVNPGFSGGWKGFVLDNHLQEGDICLFEMISKNREIVISVIIVRAADGNAKSRNSQTQEENDDSDETSIAGSRDIVTGRGSACSNHDDILQGLRLQVPRSISKKYPNAENKNQRIGSRSKKGAPRSFAYLHNVGNRQIKTRSLHHYERESIDNNKLKVISHPNICIVRNIVKNEEDKKKAFQLAHAVQSNNPCFISVMRPSMTGGRGFVTIPVRFREAHFPARSCSVRLQVPGRKKRWVLTFCFYKKRMGFCSGWKGFFHDNNLQEGNICLFELVMPRKHVFTVHIR